MSNLGAVSMSEVKHESSRDPTLSKLAKLIQTDKWSEDSDIQRFKLMRSELSVYDSMILRGDRIVLPKLLQKRILVLAHETHLGIVKTKQFLRAKFYWFGMDKDIEQMIQSCPTCVINQSLNANTPLQPSSLPSGPWVKGAVDIVGPIGGKYLLTYIDYYSSYPEAIIIRDIGSNRVIRTLSDIFARFGYPEEIVSDNGPQFTSLEFENYLKSCKIKHKRISPYYARSNGKIERFHRYLKKNIRAVVAEGKSWEVELPKILLAYRAAPHAISGISPASLLFNREIRTKIPSFQLNVAPEVHKEHRLKFDSYQKRMKSYHDSRNHAKLHTFKVGDLVFCANSKPSKLDSRFKPSRHVIIESHGRDSFSAVDSVTGSIYIRNAKHLKHAPVHEDVEIIDSEGSSELKGEIPETNTPNVEDINEPADKLPELQATESDTPKSLELHKYGHQSNDKGDEGFRDSVKQQATYTTRSGREVKTAKSKDFHYF